ncbi:hypothetical protein [Vallitalea guaymasensis]|uniref:hypothetical protein n=1 Tax=Vallitalea guaymasensis TaxID=1185412 RepID=UPI000DE231F4|nr:hypothetical protein [Vallitalea guaymasensis]
MARINLVLKDEEQKKHIKRSALDRDMNVNTMVVMALDIMEEVEGCPSKKSEEVIKRLKYIIANHKEFYK